MNKRIRSILTLLIKKPEIKMAELTNELSLTRRQINYSITQFNEELLGQQLPKIERNHAGDFILPLEVIHLISNQSQENERPAEILADDERVALLVTYLITQTDYVSMDHLTYFLEVGKTTVTEDLKNAERLLKNYQLTIQYDRKQGYQLIGLEHRIIQLLSDLVKRYAILKNEQINRQLASTISTEKVIHLIHNLEQMLHLSYSDESLDYLHTVVPLFLERGTALSEKDFNHFSEESIHDTPEYRLLGLLLSETDWELSNSYKEWLTLLFLISNIYEKKTTQDFDSDDQLKGLITQMVTSFEQQTFIAIEDRDSFERRILNHLRPACFRIKYNLSLGVYSLDSLIQDSNHAILIDMMKELIVPTEDWLGRAFPNDELELMSYYFGFQLSNQGVTKKQKPRAVVVCTNGVMVSKLIRENLEKLFSEIHFLASFSARDFYQYQVDYDLVFTTIPLETQLPQFIIEPIMTYKEQISLRYRVLNELGLSEVDQSVDRLLQLIKQYAKLDDPKKLKEELQYFLLQEKQDSPLDNFKVLPSLMSYLKPTYIKIVEDELGWKEAVRLACRPLMEDQVITEEFYLDCIRQIEEATYSGYFGEHTSIPHTTAEHGILQEGVSLLLSKKEIVFPRGKKVRMIFPLAFLDLTKHLKAVNQVADISTNPKLLDELFVQNDTKSVYQIIRKYT